MRITATGCCLIDVLYREVSYAGEAFRRLLSRVPGDGGLIPGGLVLANDLEAFAGRPFPKILREISGGKEPTAVNLGGPAIVALVHAAQLLEKQGVESRFYGIVGDDPLAGQIESFIGETPVQAFFQYMDKSPSPSTVVLADPYALEGKGERSFVHTIGAAEHLTVERFPDDVYDTDILLIGGSALVPPLHAVLTPLLRRSKEHGALTIVGTVYDFRSQKRDPKGMWPMGDRDSYRFIDLLVCDAEEALRLSATTRIEDAANRFIDWGVGALVITQGARDYLLWSGGERFLSHEMTMLPVSRWVDDRLAADPSLKGDTTGCGDNFLGGLVASSAMQLPEKPSLREAAAWAAASGGFACFYHGGTYHQKMRGEKRQLLEPIVSSYRRQIGD
jgi:sugar/nucleoside kinase (ribokinase family)